MYEVTSLSAVELIHSIRERTVRVRDVVRQVIERMEETRQLNAFISTDKEFAMSRAEELDAKSATEGPLPLHGLPVVVKDNIDTKDYITTGGTPALAHNKPAHNAGIVEKLVNAGVVVVGKTNLHELAYGITSNNAFFGPVRNPYNPELIPGGSSGGSAVAVSARITPVGLGTDTGGSARIPAALCGICGYRPSSGRYPGSGILNISPTRDTAGTFARTVEDIRLIDEVLCDSGAQEDVVDWETIRIGLPVVPFYSGIGGDVKRVIERALKRLDSRRITIVHENLDGLFELNEKVGFPIVLYETPLGLRSYISSHDLSISLETLVENIASPDVLNIIRPLLGEGAIPEEVYKEAKNKHRPALQQLYQDYFDEHNVDIIIYPTTMLTARPIGQDDFTYLDGHRVPVFPTYIRNCDPSANAGIPSLSIPVGLTEDKLPVGISIDGPAGSDRKVLSIGAAIQSILPRIGAPRI